MYVPALIYSSVTCLVKNLNFISSVGRLARWRKHCRKRIREDRGELRVLWVLSHRRSLHQGERCRLCPRVSSGIPGCSIIGFNYLYDTIVRDCHELYYRKPTVLLSPLLAYSAKHIP